MSKSIFILAAILALASCNLFDFLRKVEDTNPIFLNETYYAGFQPLDTRGSLFYWLFESRASPSTDPLIIWLTGGPGCSSELATFVENGPYRIDKDTNTLTINPYSWNNNANVIYIDQPIGTGFSTGNALDTTEDQIAADFYTFLKEFLGTYPQFNGRDFYITGESYAGHYIPAISTYLHKTGGINLNFKGLAIGNGLMSVFYQYPQYATFCYENNLIDQNEYESLQKTFAICDKLIQSGLTTLAYIECNTQVTRITGNPPRFNVYDIRLPCVGQLCYDFSYVDNFLEQPKVQQALGVTGRPWAECNDTVHSALTKDWMTDLEDDLSYLVTSGLQVLLYHGDKDFICNWRGGEAAANNVQWSGSSQFSSQNYTDFGTFGQYKSLDNFHFFRVFNAGHMVPMDQPQAASAMLARFIAGW